MAQYYDISYDLSLSDGCLCFVNPNSKVLEFGSATGYATKYMKEQLHCEVTCIEINATMAEQAKPFSKKMIVADIEQYDWQNELHELYDFILFADVLEHLREPEKVIAVAKKFLQPNGFILTSIPNIGHNAILMNLRNAKFTYTPTGLLDNTHIHFMTRESIDNMFSNNKLYCHGEEHKSIRPCNTEIQSYYFKNPLLSLSIIAKPDAHIYRFVHKWGLEETGKIEHQVKVFNLFERMFELFYDMSCFIKRKLNLKTPKILDTLIQKPLKISETNQYDKYKSKN